MDLHLLSAELVRALRGPRLSQRGLSTRLGYDANVVYLWERGRRCPSASAFFELARRRGVPVQAKLHEFLGLDSGRSSRASPARTPSLPPFLKQLSAGYATRELARLVGVDRGTLARWLRGATEPRLPELLRFVGATTLRLLDFLALFADPGALPTARRAYEQLLAQRQLAYDEPASHAVLRALELDDAVLAGGSLERRIAERTGLAPAAVAQHLLALERAGQVRRDGRRFRPTDVMSVDTRADFEHGKRLKAFWADVGRQRLEHHAPRRRSLFSYNLFAISSKELEELRRLHAEYFHRVRHLVERARGGSEVVLMNAQLVVLSEP